MLFVSDALRDQITRQADGHHPQVLGRNQCIDVKTEKHAYHWATTETAETLPSVYHHPITHREQSELKMQTLFTTMKFNRVIPATLQQDHLTLLTHGLLSDLWTGEAGYQPAAYLQESVIYIPLTGPLQTVLQHRDNLLPPWRCVWRPRWGRPGTWPGIRSELRRMAQSLWCERKMGASLWQSQR